MADLHAVVLPNSRIKRIWADERIKFADTVGFCTLLEPKGRGYAIVFEPYIVCYTGATALAGRKKFVLDTCIPLGPFLTFLDVPLSVGNRPQLTRSVAGILDRNCSLEFTLDYSPRSTTPDIVEILLEFRNNNSGVCVPMKQLKDRISLGA